jgi:hypothetical protein
MNRALNIATALVLFVFGIAQGLLGVFFHDVGPAPLAAIGFDAAILATCLLGAWALQRPIGAVAPAVGWVAVVFGLTSGTASGSVLIEASMAGEWFLFGGSVCAMAGVIAAFVRWSRSSRARL